MKKALLTLTMVCALPISSLHAGYFSSPDYDDESDPSKVSASHYSKSKAQAQAQAYVDSAKKWGLAALAGMPSSWLGLCGSHSTC